MDANVKRVAIAFAWALALAVAALAAWAPPAASHGGGDQFYQAFNLTAGGFGEVNVDLMGGEQITYGWKSTPSEVVFDLHSHAGDVVVTHKQANGTNSSDWFQPTANGTYSLFWQVPNDQPPTRIEFGVLGNFVCVSSIPSGLCGSATPATDTNSTNKSSGSKGAPGFEAGAIVAAAAVIGVAARRRDRGQNRSP